MALVHGEWTGMAVRLAQCNILHCTITSQHRYLTVDPCNTSYTSTFMVECEDDYNRLEIPRSIFVTLMVQEYIGCLMVME